MWSCCHDGWTVVTEDRMPAAHFEHTVAVTDNGVDVLTDGRVAVAATGSCGQGRCGWSAKTVVCNRVEFVGRLLRCGNFVL